MERGHALDLGRRSHGAARENRIAAWLRRPHRRREADSLLRASAGGWERHPAVEWRAAELTSARARLSVARVLRSIVVAVEDPRPRFSAAVLARPRLRPYAREIERLADRIADLERPVTGAGMLLVNDLLTDGTGPLFIGGAVADLVPTLDRIHEALEAR